MNNFDSNAFNTGQGHQDAPGGAVFFNNSLFYVANRGKVLSIVTCTPPSGQDNWTVVAPPQSNWSSYWSHSATSIKTPAGLSTPLVVLPGPSGDSALYAVGSNSTVYLMGQDQKSFTPIQIQSANGTPVETCGATAWGNYLLVGWFLTEANLLMWDAYDVTQLPNPINSGFIWKPVSESGALPIDLGLAPSGLGPVVSMDWFTTGGNNFYLVTSYMNGSNPVLVVTSMQGMVAQIPHGPYALVQQTGALLGISVLRDPGGRIALYSAVSYPSASAGKPSLSASRATVPTDTDPFGSETAWTESISGLWTQVGEGQSANQPPIGCFGLGSTYPIEEPVAGSANDVYEIVLWSPDHDEAIWANISAFGTAQQLPNYHSGALLPDPPPNSYLGAVSGIIDSPIPIPISNIANGDYTPGTNFGSVLFGSTETDTNSHTASFSYSVGISSTGVTSAGIGPAWNISLSGGQTSSSGGSDVVSTIENSSVAAQTDATGALQPYGSFFARNVLFQYNWYRLVDLQGDWVANGPAFCTVTPIYLSAIANSFESYLVTPGDLSSYTRESINAQAIALGLVPSGTDYISDVIEANAMAIGPGGENYMPYSVSRDAQVSPAYVQSTDSWTESGWTLDASIYVGLSFGATLSVNFDFIVGGSIAALGFTVENLAGTTLSSNHSSTTDQSEQLQIQLQNFSWPIPVKPTDIASCTFRLYFLKADQRWIQELAQVTGIKVDTNSQPWRILFVVDSYQSSDGTINYPGT